MVYVACAACTRACGLCMCSYEIWHMQHAACAGCARACRLCMHICIYTFHFTLAYSLPLTYNARMPDADARIDMRHGIPACIYKRSVLYKPEAYIEQVGHGRRAYAIIYQWYISIPLHSLSITRIYVTCSHCKRGHRTYSGQGMALPDRRRAHQCASVQQPCGEI
jgi:hypothetical protein